MSGPAVKAITCQQLHELSRLQPVELIDVRTAEEFLDRRALGARNAPLESQELRDLLNKQVGAADAPLYFICEMGGRSAWACAEFMAAGHSNVLNVEGGMRAWCEAGLPILHGCQSP